MSILALQNPKAFSRQHLLHLHCTLGAEKRRGGVLAVVIKKELWLGKQGLGHLSVEVSSSLWVYFPNL